MARHPASELVARFSVSVRIAHWLLAAAFAAMLGSGLVLGGFGPLTHRAMLGIHLGSAAVLVVALAGMCAARRSRRPLATFARDLRGLDAGERRWLRLAPRAYLLGGRLPEAGRFNAGQKVNARLLAVLLPALYLSGLGALHRDVSLLGPLARIGAVHGLLAGVAGVLVALHVYLAVLHPGTRHALRGMTHGTVRRDWAEEHHGRWVAELDAAERR
jgi:formate dehydrogenase subunit gamma